MSKSLLSDIAFFRTYSKVLSTGHKETYKQVIDRYIDQLFWKFGDNDAVVKIIEGAREYLLQRKITPSMRLLQFAMSGINRENLRAYNCSFQFIDSFKSFADLSYILSCGTGAGFSCQGLHIRHLPIISSGEAQDILIGDTKEAWADSFQTLLGNPTVTFDYSAIRPEGTPLSTGGKASGPSVLKASHEAIRAILKGAAGRKLRSIEVHDICCHIASAIVAGGVRRSALISLFDKDDREMLESKQGNWWENNPQRANANNSAVFLRSQMNQEEFYSVLDACFASQSGEPGIFLTNSYNYGTNPCAEISLQDKGLCNLTEINVAECRTEEEFMKAAFFATALGTIQASFTDFNYVDPKWKTRAEDEALLGVSLTGQAANWNLLNKMAITGTLRATAEHMIKWNRDIARIIGINPAKRIGTVKPSGTTSTVLGTTAGIHAAHAPYYLRTIRVDKNDPVGQYLATRLEAPFLEENVFNSKGWVVGVPVAMENAIYRHTETALDTMNRAAVIFQNWIAPSHVSGNNTHNVSLTVSYKDEEREAIKAWMWENRANYNGISLLPMESHTYQQAPYQTLSEEQYRDLAARLPSIDLSEVLYDVSDDTRSGEAACSANGCDFK